MLIWTKWNLEDERTGKDSYFPPRSMTIAGSGIQTDRKTFADFQVYGYSIITELTVQNTFKVSGIHVVISN